MRHGFSRAASRDSGAAEDDDDDDDVQMLEHVLFSSQTCMLWLISLFDVSRGGNELNKAFFLIIISIIIYHRRQTEVQSHGN